MESRKSKLLFVVFETINEAEESDERSGHESDDEITFPEVREGRTKNLKIKNHVDGKISEMHDVLKCLTSDILNQVLLCFW
ncbi:uncharacterized protein G2W53_015566 [Senna tora]|uniref:Uncharacterized protein n=1 Tax=Senna tora TaxID=362788 RepID=A0A834WWI1_9FABA|nr:uncharacterized protein G2W53_015566 [Senna tora]